MEIQKKENHFYMTNHAFVMKAEGLKKKLIVKKEEPTGLVTVQTDPNAVHGWKCKKVADIDSLDDKAYGKGESLIVDFGDHQVGYLVMKIRPIGSPPDAPLHLRLTFGEMPIEMGEDFATYDGWVSSSWLQQETIHIDVLPHVLQMPRRYSFRYLKIEVLDASPKYAVAFDEIYCETVTSADTRKLSPITTADPLLAEMDRISIKTLQDCMQDIFEDGPKRDRRLWLGDLRLQALANYETFKNYDLVKRCLYLFAAVTDENGQVSSNVFVAPNLIPDDTYLFDYSSFFPVTLYDYFVATEDLETAKELWPTAYRQIELALERVNENHLVMDDTSGAWWAFIDWHKDLNKQAAAHAILIYAMKRALGLARAVNDEKRATFLDSKIKLMKKAAVEYLWDEKQQFFVSGAERQVSWASQVWMVLAEVFDIEKSSQLIDMLLTERPAIGPVTPYMYHHLIDALIMVDERDVARQVMKEYWGEMIEDGADTFWESYDPKNKNFSPYGNSLINSYCHAWSCTPTYFIRKYKMY